MKKELVMGNLHDYFEMLSEHSTGLVRRRIWSSKFISLPLWGKV
ncbi:hypothetical protein [Desulforamulus ruminis]|nr:hypothetical protein [Desulforamulus ruminis]